MPVNSAHACARAKCDLHRPRSVSTKSPPWHQLRILLAKDLYLHGKTGVATLAGALLFCEVSNRIISSGIGPRLTFVVNVNFLLTLVWSELLVTRERTTGTFSWLRTLPVDDRTVVASKFIGGSAWCVACWILSSGLSAPELWHRLGTWFVLQATLLTFGALSLASKWRFPNNLGHLLPVGMVAVLLGVVVAIAGDGTPTRILWSSLWDTSFGRPILTAALLVLYALILGGTVWWVSHADTEQFID